MPVKIYVGTEPEDSSRTPSPHNYFHEMFPGSIRILRRLWPILHPKNEITAVLISASASLEGLNDPARRLTLNPDMLFITSTGIGVLEQKHYPGEMGVNPNGSWYFTTPTGERKKMNSGQRQNPCEQVKGYKKTLERELTRSDANWLVGPVEEIEDYRFPKIQTSVCFTNPKADFSRLKSNVDQNQCSILGVDNVLAWVQSLRLGMQHQRNPNIFVTIQVSVRA